MSTRSKDEIRYTHLRPVNVSHLVPSPPLTSKVGYFQSPQISTYLNVKLGIQNECFEFHNLKTYHKHLESGQLDHVCYDSHSKDDVIIINIRGTELAADIHI